MSIRTEINDTNNEIEIYKKIKPGSGIGSSAASAAGAVFAISFKTTIQNSWTISVLGLKVKKHSPPIVTHQDCECCSKNGY